MAQSRLEGDLHINGALTAKTFSAPAGSITNAMVATGAAIDATKLVHRHAPFYSISGTVATTTVVLHNVYGATATVVAAFAGSVVAAIGDSTVTVDIKKNGTTILTAVITLDSGNSAYVKESGTVTVPAGVAGDVYTAVITATAGTGTLPTGFYCGMVVTEDAA